MATEARGRILARVDDELADSAADLDVFTAGPVTGFAPCVRDAIRCIESVSTVRAGVERARVICVAIITGVVADVICAGDFRRRQNFLWKGGAGIQQYRRDQHANRQKARSDWKLQ